MRSTASATRTRRIVGPPQPDTANMIRCSRICQRGLPSRHELSKQPPPLSNEHMIRYAPTIAFFFLLLACAATARSEDGYDLWLRYRALDATQQARYRAAAQTIVAARDSATMQAAA